MSAVQRGADGTFVFVVSPDKTANQRTVKLGVQDGDKVAVLTGLKPGDTVVVDGADRLRDGAQVSVPGPAQKIQAPSGGAAPAVTAARAQALAALTQACSADIPKFCAGQAGIQMQRCLRQNQSSVSSACQAQLARGGRGGRGGGGGGGGFGGAP